MRCYADLRTIQKRLKSMHLRASALVQLLFTKLVPGCEWASTFDWQYWKDAGRALEADHRTVARERSIEAEMEQRLPWGDKSLKENVAFHHKGLLNKLIAALRTKHRSISTEKSYVNWFCRFIAHYDFRNPAELREEAVASFLEYLAVKRLVAASTQNQALNALVFAYREALGAPLGTLPDVVRAKRPRYLPVVMTKNEVRRVLETMAQPGRSDVMRLMATLCYGGGLRSCSADFA